MHYETDRLTLRPFAPGDEAPVLRLLSDERVVRHTLFPRFDARRAAEYVARCAGEETEEPRRSLTRALTDRQTGELVGSSGLVLGRMEDAELWYVLAPGHWGRGLAGEAVAAMLTAGFRDLGLHRVWATVVPGNPASTRVLERAGFRPEGYQVESLRIHGEWTDCHQFALLRREWEALGAAAALPLPN